MLENTAEVGVETRLLGAERSETERWRLERRDPKKAGEGEWPVVTQCLIATQLG